MDIKVKFGKNLKQLRLEKGISQEKLAFLADLDRTYIPSIEKGERKVFINRVKQLIYSQKLTGKVKKTVYFLILIGTKIIQVQVFQI